MTEPSQPPSATKDIADRLLQTVDIEFLVHELKDPLAVIETAIRSLLERTAKYGPLTGRQEKVLQRALRGSRRARDMVQNLLEVGRSECGAVLLSRFEPATVLLDTAVEALETYGCNIEEKGDIAAALEHHDLYLTCADTLRHTTVLSDEIKFTHIVGNLVKNALYHRRRKIEIELLADSTCLEIFVRDDGPGVAPENRDLIFERYMQGKDELKLKRRGHGLGLAGARIMARCLQGDLELVPINGPGAVFRLLLPLNANAAGCV